MAMARRASEHIRSTGNGKAKYKQSEAVASHWQQQRMKYLGHTVGVSTPTRNIPDSSIAYNRGVKASYRQKKKYCNQNSNSRLIDMHKDKG